jgi:hypothetical protein
MRIRNFGMMKVSILLFLIVALAFPAMAQPMHNPMPAQAAPAPGSVWSINVLGLKGESLGHFTIQLLDESGDWGCASRVRKARLMQGAVPSNARKFETKDYFPTYRTDGARLTILLTSICDYSLFLSGRFSAREGHGDYAESGRGYGKTLGTFTAKRQQ